MLRRDEGITQDHVIVRISAHTRKREKGDALSRIEAGFKRLHNKKIARGSFVRAGHASRKLPPEQEREEQQEEIERSHKCDAAEQEKIVDAQ